MSINNIFSRCNVVKQQQERLDKLSQKSVAALDIVTSTINSLDEINTEIDGVICDIARYKDELANTETQLEQTKAKNFKISSKFRSLIED